MRLNVMQNIKLLLSLLLIPLTGLCQDSDQLITEIRAEFKRINSTSQLEKIELFNDTFMEYHTDGGGQLTGFFENNNLVKITEWIGPSHGTLITDYYLKDGKLFFAYQQENKFKDIFDESGEWIGLNTSQEETKFEGRYYFHNKKLIKQLNKGTRMFDQVFEQRKFLEHMNSIAELLRKKKTIKNLKH